MSAIVFISERNRERYLKVVSPFGRLLAKLGIHPNILTGCGLILSIVAGIFYGGGSFFWAAWIVALAGTCDTLDGQLARNNNQKSRFGAFFDSTLDRYSEIFLFLGLAYYFSGGRPPLSLSGVGVPVDPSPWTVTVIVMAIAGSFMVSYTRARAEGLGIDCKVGLMQRPERIVLLIIGSLLGSIPNIGPSVMKLTIVILAVTSNVTAMHRLLHVHKLFREGEGG